ncbi:hypothetical protein EVA_20794, partial [gut metagenome]
MDKLSTKKRGFATGLLAMLLTLMIAVPATL